ncbi:uncharacterized protein LOC133806340 [Humulus lupulus]|uniref:uncharacterized protein LOC133806340 n=1 Tax=Humulus lupulus TaxID=3486 RepID=UPI002B40DBCC|nr:uncharacterized protein LOC133806340 [Humulus lupulus]
MADSKIYPATTITNIKTSIPIVLDMENDKYINWSTLFKLHCHAHLVYEHIVPSPESTETPTVSSSTDAEKATAKALPNRLDAIVIQWIYSTISLDLLNSIIELDDKAKDAWNRLMDIFQDNQNSRAIFLDTEFTNTHLSDFPNVSAYCNRLKVLVDQLENVGANISDKKLVVKLIAGLTEAYNDFVTVIQQRDPLPSFSKARSMLCLEEKNMQQRAQRDSGSTSSLLVTSSTDNSVSYG